MRGFRFGCNIRSIRSGEAVADLARDAERRGYDALLVPDHLGRNRPAPFPTMVAAAGATDGLRVGPFVLNVGFWNPSLLAREAATTDQLTGGRLELGLGAGHMKSEFDAAGIPWQPFAERVDRFAATVDELDRLFADEQAGYDTIQKPQPPLMIAGVGHGVLRLAARRADILGFTGILQAEGRPPGTFRLATAAECDERMRFFREEAGPRASEIEVNVLVQRVAVTQDRWAAAERFVAEAGPGLTVEAILESPVLLIGTVRQIADQVLERRKRYGFSYVCVHEPDLAEFSRVIELLR